MRITKVICGYDTESGQCSFIESGVSVDRVIRQMESRPVLLQDEPDGLCQLDWSLKQKEIFRYEIAGGKAKLVTKKTIDGERTFVENASTVCIGKAYEGEIRFGIRDGERIYGLGQQEDGVLNQRGVKVPLYQNNMQIPMPVIVSSCGYGILLDVGCLMIYEEKDNVMTFHLDAVDKITYYVIEGDSADEIVAGIRKLTGQASRLPKWAFGYIQSRERYKTQQEILDIREEFARREIPVSCLVLDWMSWESGKWGNKQFDRERFPSAGELVEELHRQNTAFMVSVWPNMNKGTENNREMLEAGKLLANLSTYDAFDPQARDMYWKQLKEEILSAGTDALWCDSTEPFTPDWSGPEKKDSMERYELSKENLTRYFDARQGNAYALHHAKGIYENHRRENRDQRIVNLTRSGYPSIQKYGTILWSGDIAAEWKTMKNQIVEGLSMCASGMPYWTLDIGAFFTGTLDCWRRFSGNPEADGPQPWFWHGLFEDGVKDLGYRELYVRWLQYGAFLPIMRSHGTDTPREPWFFGDKGDVWYDTIVKYIRLRYKLLPYIYSLADKVVENSGTMMRPLEFDFPRDAKACVQEAEYMFGDFLVCPVTEAMEYGPDSTRLDQPQVWDVYLPDGFLWYDYSTKKCLEGGRDIKADAPVSHMPLYIRAGAIVPVSIGGGEGDSGLCPVMEAEIVQQMGLELYGGRDGSFTIYLDAGNGYGYEQGEWARVPVTYDDGKSLLTLRKKEGNYPVPDKFVLEYYYKGQEKVTKEVLYRGAEVTLQL